MGQRHHDLSQFGRAIDHPVLQPQLGRQRHSLPGNDRPHLSLEGAQAFFQDRDGAIHLSLQPRKGESVPCEVICLGTQFDTMLAYNELLSGRPWTADLAAIAKNYQLPAILATRKPGR